MRRGYGQPARVGTVRRRKTRFSKKKSSREKVISTIARAVQSRILNRPMLPQQQRSKQITVWSSLVNWSLHSADTNSTAILPITWCIPRMRYGTAPSDTRLRESNDVWLSGVKLSFRVNYTGAFRMRFFVQRNSLDYPFESTELPTIGGVVSTIPDKVFPVQAFKLVAYPFTSWVPPKYTPPWWMYMAEKRHGTYEVAPDEPGGIKTEKEYQPNWVIPSPDGTPFSAKTQAGEYRPIGDLKVSDAGASNTEGTAGTVRWKEVDWFVPIKQTIRYLSEHDKIVADDQYLLWVYWDCPAMSKTSKTAVAIIPNLSVTVYYR